MRKYTIQEKIAHLEARAASGLKMADYAALHNINFNSFRCWSYYVKKALSAKSINSIQETSVHATDVIEDEIINSASKIDTSTTPVSQSAPLTATLVPVKVLEPNRKVLSQTHKDKPAVFPEINMQKKCHPDKPNIHESDFQQPIPEVTVILPSGLQVKCDIVLLEQVIGVVS